MKTDLGLDDEINAIWSKIATSATGLTGRIEALLTAAFHSASNPFGSAATKNVGTDPDNVPVVGASGDLPKTIFPSFLTSWFSGFVPSARLPTALNASKIKTATAGDDPNVDRIYLDNRPNQKVSASAITSGIVSDKVLPDSGNQIKTIEPQPCTIKRLRLGSAQDGTFAQRNPPLPDGLQVGVEKIYEGSGSIDQHGNLIINLVWPITSN